MSIANYSASVAEHTQILISVKRTSNSSEAAVNFLLGKLKDHEKLVINDAGCAINIRFESDASPENSSWGHFQAHRQVHGLIFIAGAATPMEAALAQDKFNKTKEAYGPGLCQSRCLIFGVDTTIRHSHNQDIFQFSSHEAWKSVDYDVKQLITSIFYNLESKRLKMVQEKNARPLLILAPFEVSDPEIEPDSKLFRKKCTGRHLKHLADVSLLTGQLVEALMSYHSALDILISTNDSVWIGSALEGLCAISAQILFSDLDLAKTHQAKNSKQVLDPRNLLNKQTSAPNPAELRKLCIPTVEDLVDRYKELIIHYSRSKSLGIIEMEACIKATKVLTRGKKFLEASEFLQNAVYITLNLPDSERIKRYSVLADLYKNIGFSRKSSFYKRVAAMHSVAPQLKEPDWEHCNILLLKALSGYGLDLKDDCSDCTLNKGLEHGWSSVRLRILHELVFSFEKVGNQLLANRQMMFLLIKMLSHLSETEEKDVCSALENFVRKNKQTDTSRMPKNDALGLPDLALYVLPIVKTVTPTSLANDAKPMKGTPGKEKSESVFIYTPASYQSSQKYQKTPFTWCVNTACKVNIIVENPLAHSPLCVADISLITDASSSALKCQPLSFSIPPKGTKEVGMIVTPSCPGQIHIVGYRICVYGFASLCYFRNIPHMLTEEIDIEVIQELPLLKCSCPADQPAAERAVSVTVYHGEKYPLSLSLTNTGQCAVQDVKTFLKEKPDENLMSVFLGDVSGQLPLESNATLALPIVFEPKCISDGTSVEDCVLGVRYAGFATNSTWWRSIDIDMKIKTMTCVTLNKIQVTDEPPSSENCVALLEVENMLEEDLEVAYECLKSGEKSSMTKSIAPHTVKEFSIVLRRIPLSSVSDDADSMEDYCTSFLNDHLKLEWSCRSSGNLKHRTGTINIRNTQSRTSVCCLLRSPFDCQMQLDGSACDQQVNVDVGKPNEISYEFFNVSTFSYNMEVQLEIFQDQQNGYVERDMTNSVLCIGSTKEALTIDPQKRSDFKCALLFLRAGRYDVRISYQVNLLHDVQFKFSSPASHILYQSPILNINAL